MQIRKILCQVPCNSNFNSPKHPLHLQKLGHQALSCNAILDNRINQQFSNNPKKIVEKLIEAVLQRLTTDG